MSSAWARNSRQAGATGVSRTSANWGDNTSSRIESSCSCITFLLATSVIQLRGSMETYSAENGTQIVERVDRGPRRTERHACAGDSVEHPDREGEAGVVGKQADVRLACPPEGQARASGTKRVTSPARDRGDGSNRILGAILEPLSTDQGPPDRSGREAAACRLRQHPCAAVKVATAGTTDPLAWRRSSRSPGT